MVHVYSCSFINHFTHLKKDICSLSKFNKPIQKNPINVISDIISRLKEIKKKREMEISHCVYQTEIDDIRMIVTQKATKMHRFEQVTICSTMSCMFHRTDGLLRYKRGEGSSVPDKKDRNDE